MRPPRQTGDELQSRRTAFGAWFESRTWPLAVTDRVTKLRNGTDDTLGDMHPGRHRTSNQVDRPMNRLHRDCTPVATCAVRSYCTTSARSPRAATHPLDSPAHRLNYRRHHTHGLHNLQVSASHAGDKMHI